jgi:hypothetical protein
VDADGTPWMIVSLDFAEHDVIIRTLRLDFDGSMIVGGWSPADLNWDSGVRAALAGVDVSSRDGIRAEGTPAELAALAATWFDRHRSLG